MSWNPLGAEPGGEEPDHAEPYPPPYGGPDDYGPPPGHGQPDAAEPYPPQYAPPPGNVPWSYGQPPVYGQPPAYGQPLAYDQPTAYDQPAAFGQPSDASEWQQGYGPQDAEPDEEPPPRGRTVTPLRLVALVALVVSGAVAAVSLLVLRGEQSIPITVAALAIFGFTATLIGVAFAAAGVRAANDGRVRRAVFGGLVGGLFVLVASGAAASAVIFALLSRS